MQCMLQHLLGSIPLILPFPPLQDPRILANLRAVSEAAKVGLSTREKVVIRMPLGGGIEAELSRQLFEGLTNELFRRARLPLDQACWQVGAHA